jgi:hypothetical protein
MTQANEFHGHRHASLKLSYSANRQVIIVGMSLERREDDFVKVNRAAYGLSMCL